MTELDQVVRMDLMGLFQSPEFAEAIGNAFVKGLSARDDTGSEKDKALRGLLPLLKEYATKLRQWEFQSDSDVSNFQRFRQTAKKLAQFVSQRMSGATDDFLRVELEIRLADYECALANASARTRVM